MFMITTKLWKVVVHGPGKASKNKKVGEARYLRKSV